MYVLALLVCLAAAVGAAAYIAVREQRILTVRVLLLLNYALMYPLSGLAHIFDSKRSNRGYYDLLASGEPQLLVPTVATAIGLAGLLIGLRPWLCEGRRNPWHLDRRFWLDKTETAAALAGGFLLLLLSTYALMVMLTYRSALGLERIIIVSDGYARYAILSHWFAWAASLIALALVGTRHRRPAWITVGVTLVAVVAIVASLRWSGGRSIILLMILPLVATMLPRIRNARWFLGIVGVTTLAFYISSLTRSRYGSYLSGMDLSVMNWVDWEWGRFSMIGFADHYVSNYGLLAGETFVNAVYTLIEPAAGLLGLSGAASGYLSSSEIVGRTMYGDIGVNSVVPGFSAELYLNFGFIGVLLGYVLLGRLCARVDAAAANAKGAVQYLAWAYVGYVLVFRTLPSDSLAVLAYLFYSGAPLIGFALLLSYFHRRLPARRPSVRWPAPLAARPTAA